MSEIADFALERMVLSMFFAAPKDMLTVLALEVEPIDFANGNNRAVLTVFQDLVDQGAYLDLEGALARARMLGMGIEDEHLTAIYQARTTIDLGNKDYYIGMLKRYSLVRRIHDAAQYMLTIDTSLDYPDIIETADALLATAIDEEHGKILERVGGDDFMSRITHRLENPIEGTLGLKTNMPFFDITFDGLVPQKLVLIGGRPGQGKSALGQNLISNVAILQKEPCLLIDTETSKNFVEDRLLSILSGQDYRAISHGWVTPESVLPYVQMVAEGQLYYHYMPKINTKELMLLCRKYKKSKGIKAVFVDFLGAPETEKGHIELGVKVKDMHDIANILDVSFTVFQQLNREQLDKTSGKTTKEVELGHFAQSDMSTWYPDGIAGIRLPTTVEKQKYGCNRMIDVPKNRFGEAGVSLPMRFTGGSMRFEGIEVF